jgi:hypothetical protein
MRAVSSAPRPMPRIIINGEEIRSPLARPALATAPRPA